MDGAELIVKERRRQIQEEGWTSEHDDQHSKGELALAAVCYATPVRVYIKEEWPTGDSYSDPWPDKWDFIWDKRSCYNPEDFSPKERIDFLVKAGALIAAEIDRLQRKCLPE